MVNCVLGFTALGSAAVCVGLFLLRLHNIVTPYDPICRTVNLAYILFAIFGTLSGTAFVARRVFFKSRTWAAGLRWSASVVSSAMAFIVTAAVSFYFCLGMNFLGQ